MFFVTCACLVLFSCKKVVKEFSENAAEKTITKSVTKEAIEKPLQQIGKKELKVLKWSDLLGAIKAKMPILSESIERLDKPVQQMLGKGLCKDYRFYRAITSSNTVLDRCQLFSKEAPRLMKDANFIQMFVKSEVLRKEGKQCFIDNLIAKEEKGLVRFYDKSTKKVIAEYKDGVVKTFDKSFLNQEFIPNACYSIASGKGKKCTYLVDDFGRISSVEAKNMSPEEIVSDIVNRTGNNDFGKDWEKALNKLKQASRSDDVNVKCKFSYANEEDVAPKYARIDADINGKKNLSGSFENVAKRVGNTFTAEENRSLLKKYSSKLSLSSEKSQRLLSEMNADNELAVLIHENPDFNIKRWLNTRNHVDKNLIARSPKGKMPQNARVYAGNVYYFNPHLNSSLKSRLMRGNGTANLRGMGTLSYEDLVKLDKMYPEGVPFSKRGFPDFSHVAAKGKDGNPIMIDIKKLSGDSNKDRIAAENIFQSKGYKCEEGFTWHHVEGTTCLMRVPTSIHQLVDHSGAMSMSALKI